MNNLQVSGFFFFFSFWSAENNYCLWQVKGLRFYFPPLYHLAPLHCIDSCQLPSGHLGLCLGSSWSLLKLVQQVVMHLRLIKIQKKHNLVE